MTGFTWSRTFPGTHHDFVARDAEGFLVGRIRREHGGPQSRKWVWFANGIEAAPGTVGCDLNGVVDTRKGAIERLHAAWERWMATGGAAHRVR